MAYDIHIKTADGGVAYLNAFSYGLKDGMILWVQAGDDLDHADTIHFAPGYWQQYVVDPHSADPLDLGLDAEDDEYEDDDDYEPDEDYEDDEDEGE
ncbi:hypothetical protein [Mycobacterium talmoniae]|uniref:Uncharacterized protein n=1 Tax=Mycobacterium talmoniae TaxID=1858794 RepID=A0A1S1NHL1_9MYCO|nr:MULTISPECIES: hypothetical protein [Mycobacterium]OHV05281.1 hypothetical protein BKN37_06375 [Mycobacterium talmoniae]PQM46836.1 hypothetical protein C1Y40_03006 [Mycobacterium talmoniae]TDH52280.1 hypothetical protein E2F47_14585 [Mycobacterium eburneum]